MKNLPEIKSLSLLIFVWCLFGGFFFGLMGERVVAEGLMAEGVVAEGVVAEGFVAERFVAERFVAERVLLAVGNMATENVKAPLGSEGSLAAEPSKPGTDSLSLDQKLGRMLMIGFRGVDLLDPVTIPDSIRPADQTLNSQKTLQTEPNHIIRDLQQYHLGGVILFDADVPTGSNVRNIESPEQTKTLIRQLREIAGHRLYVAVDQEGGRVMRLKSERGFIPTPSAKDLATQASTLNSLANDQAKQLASLGFDINFAPVVDLNNNPENPVIGRLGRSFSASPDTVVQLASVIIEAHLQHNILPVLKHFPGHGSAWNDSHLGMTDITDTWHPDELLPYRTLLPKYPSLGVMTAHVVHRDLDPSHPATLSAAIQQKLLREELGFRGPLFSDDMQMRAIREHYELRAAVKYALLAGVDILVFANNSVYDPDIVPRVIGVMKELLDEGVLTEERVDASIRRIQSIAR